MNKNKYRKMKSKELFDKVVQGVENIVNSGEYQKYLKFQKNFTKYSFCNKILIYSQFPDATRVAGKKAWRDMGREIIPEAQKIQITAGIPKKCQRKVKKIVDGKEVEEVENYYYMSYTSVYVYDISQTIGKPMPLQSERINCDDKDYFYDKLKEFSNVPVIEKEISGSTLGYYSKKENIIAIKNTLSPDDKAAVLLHEIAHSLYDDFDYSKDRELSEVFVESVAYIVADYFGLDTSQCSFNYIIKWAKGEPKTVIELGGKIQKCANEFIRRLEKFKMQELEVAA